MSEYIFWHVNTTPKEKEPNTQRPSMVNVRFFLGVGVLVLFFGR